MSNKKTDKQKIEEARQQIVKQYKNEINELRTENIKLKEDIQHKEVQLSKLEDKAREYEEWIERMQDFCNMSEEERTAYLKNMQESKETSEILKTFTSSLSILNSYIM